MPIIIEGAADRYIIGQIHSEHPRRRPNIHHMSIDRVAPVREDVYKRQGIEIAGLSAVLTLVKPGLFDDISRLHQLIQRPLYSGHPLSLIHI